MPQPESSPTQRSSSAEGPTSVMVWLLYWKGLIILWIVHSDRHAAYGDDAVHGGVLPRYLAEPVFGSVPVHAGCGGKTRPGLLHNN